MICEQVKKVFPFRFVIVTAKESKKKITPKNSMLIKLFFFGIPRLVFECDI